MGRETDFKDPVSEYLGILVREKLRMWLFGD